MKAVFMYITDYCVYLHMQHISMDTDVTDIYSIICLYLYSFQLHLAKTDAVLYNSPAVNPALIGVMMFSFCCICFTEVLNLMVILEAVIGYILRVAM